MFLFFAFLCLNASADEFYRITDLTGKWVGKRYQFSKDKSIYEMEFSYELQLTQVGKKVTGISLITSSSGAKAKINIVGFIENDNFFFEETHVIEATRDYSTFWCLKKGVLKISEIKDGFSMRGYTPSFMEQSKIECTGGYSYFARSIKEIPSTSHINDIVSTELKNNTEVNVFPNPFQSETTISFVLDKKSIIFLDVVDINGNSNILVNNTELEAGKKEFVFIPASANSSNTFYIVRLYIDNKLYVKSILRN